MSVGLVAFYFFVSAVTAQQQTWTAQVVYADGACATPPFFASLTNTTAAVGDPCVPDNCTVTPGPPSVYVTTRCYPAAPALPDAPVGAAVIAYYSGPNCSQPTLETLDVWTVTAQCVPLTNGSFRVLCQPDALLRIVYTDDNCAHQWYNETLMNGPENTCSSPLGTYTQNYTCVAATTTTTTPTVTTAPVNHTSSADAICVALAVILAFSSVIL